MEKNEKIKRLIYICLGITVICGFLSGLFVGAAFGATDNEVISADYEWDASWFSDGDTYTEPEDFGYVVITGDGSGNYSMCRATSALKYSSGSLVYIKNAMAIMYSYSEDENIWDASLIYNWSSARSIFNGEGLVYSNHDIVDSDTGEVFFSETIVKTPVLRLIATGTEMEKTMEEIMMMTPIILVFLAGFLGFLKAFRTLRQILSQA